MTSARETAARALLAVFEQGGYSNLVLDHSLEKEDLSPMDRSFCAALFYGVAERLITLDYSIAAHCKTPPRQLSPAVLMALRCGFYQLLYMPSVPESAAVNETVTLVKTLGEPRGAGLVNGVLRGFLRAGKVFPEPRDKLTALSVRYSIPMPLIQMWRKSYGQEDTLRILEGLSTVPPLFVRVNTTRVTPETLLTLLAEEGVEATRCASLPNALRLRSSGSIAKLESFRQGLFHVQDLSSQLCAEAGGPAPGMRVLDVCAAPGGKSFTMAELMVNTGELVACDLYASRAALVAEGAARLGLTCVATMVRDAGIGLPPSPLSPCTADLSPLAADIGVTPPLPSLSPLNFDLVLCDVVCSGFGILRRKPEIRYKALETLDELPKIQYNILDTSSSLCKPGGRLVYSTCTLRREENEEVAERFLGEHPEFSLAGPMRTIFPGEAEGADGFFYAVLART